MATILVSGLINIETTLRVAGFPLEYNPVNYPFWGVNSTVSGVGYNLTKALIRLGDAVRFVSLIGDDLGGQLVRSALAHEALPQAHVLSGLRQTPQSAILYDSTGRRQIHVDLKDAQETPYPPERFAEALAEVDLAVLCNINFSRPFLRTARECGVRIATDVHTIADLDDAYNRDFMAAADILFMSDEALPLPPEQWVRELLARYRAEIVVVGLGAQGALLAVRSDGTMERFPAVFTRPVVNSIGAGDALFSAFIHFYAQGHDPYRALRKAQVFASYKIGEKGAAEGFLTETELYTWYLRVQSH